MIITQTPGSGCLTVAAALIAYSVLTYRQYNVAQSITSTYDHIYQKIWDPVPSPIDKLVVKLVTTSKYPVLYVFVISFCFCTCC